MTILPLLLALQLPVSYTLRVDSADLSGFRVEMRLRSPRDTFTLAMARHPEYHDRFWRYVEDLRVTTSRGAAQVMQRESAAPAPSLEGDSALWHVSGASGDVTISYRIHLPAPTPPPRASWRPFLAPTGGLFGGPHSFMYVVGREGALARVTLDLPGSWLVATGLDRTADPRVFTARDVEALVESPILIGRLHIWHFAVNGVPHHVAYWPLPSATPFDTAAFVGNIERLVRETMTLFGGAPYREFTFLVQDGAYGGLEHPASVTSGSPSAELARNQAELLGETAHEFIHTWNLVAIRPVERAHVSYRVPTPEASLWFGEGFTLYYADLLLRRAGVTLQSTREAHLGNLIARYLANPAYLRYSAEAISRADNSPPDALGDYRASTHLQGELIAAMLEFVVRDATTGSRSLDDVMRLMFQRSAGQRGITGADVERAVEDVCGCDVTPLFDANVRGTEPIDFARWLRLGGLGLAVTSAPVRGRDGALSADLGIWGWTAPRDTVLRLMLTSPDNPWGRAGLHSGDALVSWNGIAIREWAEMRLQVARLHIGDTVRVAVNRPSGTFVTTVAVTGYDRPIVTVSPLPAGR